MWDCVLPQCTYEVEADPMTCNQLTKILDAFVNIRVLTRRDKKITRAAKTATIAAATSNMYVEMVLQGVQPCADW
jgi:hypothetical protein